MSTAVRSEDRASVLAIGFGTTVAMWAIGYCSRIPPARVPSVVVGLLMIAALVAGGFVLGRRTARGVRGGLQVGLLSAALNMLILGSLLTDADTQTVVPAAIWWIPGALLASAALAGVGAALGGGARERTSAGAGWSSVFASVATVATLLLLGVGGLVTSWEAGLAVVDWPNSFGSNMFLYPLSRMTGGIYYEHAHRLFGSLVGLTTLVLAVHLWRHDDRPFVRRLGVAAFVMVVVQGLLGGLRVTGHFTLSTDAAETAPSLVLAVVHGVFGQLFFATMASLAVLTCRGYRHATPEPGAEGAARDRALTTALVHSLVLQLVLGALVRHYDWGTVLHIGWGSLVAVAGIVVGVRAWGVRRSHPPLRRGGIALLVLIPLQLVLGLAALTAILLRGDQPEPGWGEVLLATLHQVNGALTLATSFALLLWTRRLFPRSGAH